jgi:hypothetical protein
MRGGGEGREGERKRGREEERRRRRGREGERRRRRVGTGGTEFVEEGADGNTEASHVAVGKSR